MYLFIKSVLFEASLGLTLLSAIAQKHESFLLDATALFEFRLLVS